ncbi:bifunctional 2-polyprenyl-6-hydroxyphenol methylase/3-demethylubiquinol 3-O-methyltransferase UbiG [Paenibacillus sp. LK1]|uniref:class I SAM-dependent methyltransferase n=1 Tax=Paenibacillus sp. LK1 TaxID=2053014 RepID=UPI0015D5185B|nr:class I SAM-dependent methyltransferase [Paenibacillus sp. LK1]
MKAKRVIQKSNEQLALEWDSIAHIRAEQIEREQDLSYKYILVPGILSLISNKSFNNIIDIGCGSGHLTQKLKNKGKIVTGVDLSEENISIAQTNYSESNINFTNASIENFSRMALNGSYDLAVANMTLMDVHSLENTLEAVSKILCKKGEFVFSITHPCFWPFYWNYWDEEWFDYSSEIFIESSFKISLSSNENIRTTHIHRPLEYYIRTLKKFNFQINTVVEPLPTPDVESLYPVKWKFPRFLLAHCSTF